MSDTPETDAKATLQNLKVALEEVSKLARILKEERDEAREVVQNIVRAGQIGCRWQSYAIAFLEKSEAVK